MEAVGGLLIILIFIFWGLFKLLNTARRNAIERAERRAYQAKITSKEYLAEQEKIKQETIKGYEKLAKEAEEDPDQNIWDNNYFDMRKVHFARLEKFGRSKFMEKPTTLAQEVEYILFQQTELEIINIK